MSGAPPFPMPPFEAGGLEPYEGAIESPLVARVLAFVRERDAQFRLVRRAAIPWSAPSRPLSESRIALLSTGALHLRGDRLFRALEDPAGDTSFRVVPHAATNAELDLEVPYLDTKYTTSDPEVALPRRALDALVVERRVGAAAPQHFSFCGGVLRPFPGLRESARGVVEHLRREHVDALVLIPTCSICVNTVALLAGEIESLGIPTVSLTLLPEITRIVGVPRALALHFPFGAPCGDPGNASLQLAVLREALELLHSAERGEVRASRHAWRRAGDALPENR